MTQLRGHRSPEEDTKIQVLKLWDSAGEMALRERGLEALSEDLDSASSTYAQLLTSTIQTAEDLAPSSDLQECPYIRDTVTQPYTSKSKYIFCKHTHTHTYKSFTSLMLEWPRIMMRCLCVSLSYLESEMMIVMRASSGGCRH